MNNQYEIQNEHSEYSDYESFDDEQQMQFNELKECISNKGKLEKLLNDLQKL